MIDGKENYIFYLGVKGLSTERWSFVPQWLLQTTSLFSLCVFEQ